MSDRSATLRARGTSRPAPAPSRRPPRAGIVVVAAGAVLVIAAAIAATLTIRDGERTDATANAPSPTAALVPVPPAPPRGLEADADPFAVALAWEPDATGGPTEGYTVYRDGEEIATVDGSATASVVDDAVSPLVRYTYSVAAVGEDGLASEPTELAVRTPEAPLADARLEGTFDVRLRERSTFGYTASGGDARGGWTFSPRCDDGVCDVAVARLFRGAESVRLAQRSATYRAGGQAELGVKCRGARSTSDYAIRVEVVRARTVDGVWRAVAIAGTFVHREPAQLGCVAGGADLSFRGRLVRL